MQKKMKITAGILTVFFCLLSGCQQREKTEGFMLLPAESPTEESGEEEGLAAEKEAGADADSLALAPTPAPVIVHICGAVKIPGVYTLEAGSRIFQAIALAGGFSEQAKQDYLNQAEPLTDGMKVYVPTKEEVEALQTEGNEAPLWVLSADSQMQDEGLVNINTADEAQLCTLPGVGSSKAESIIRYREAHGAFQKIEDIMNVEGIKDGLFNKIKDSITV